MGEIEAFECTIEFVPFESEVERSRSYELQGKRGHTYLI